MAKPQMGEFHHHEEPDVLRELCRALWQQAWLILLVTSLCVLMGSVYIYTSTPLYEAKAYLVSTVDEDLARLVYKQKRSLLLNTILLRYPLQKAFTETLSSRATKQTFFDEAGLEQAYKQFNKHLTVLEVPYASQLTFMVAMKAQSPEKAVDLVTRYVSLVKKNTMKRVERLLSADAMSHVNIFDVDGPIMASGIPVLPQKKLIMILFSVLGLSLGGLIAIARALSFVRRSR